MSAVTDMKPFTFKPVTGITELDVYDDDESLDHKSYFDSEGLLLIRAKHDYSYPGSDTIESTLTIVGGENVIVTLDNSGVLREAFYMNADDNNRLHVNRGNLISVKRG